MADVVGTLAVRVVADTKAMVAQIGAAATGAGTGSGSKFGKLFAGAAVAGIAGAAIGKSINMAGDFEQQMNIIQEAAAASGEEMKGLSDLAIQMGADTTFSAGESAAAMLELVKAGLSPAQIEAGALKQALSVAATEGIGLAESATIMSNAMNTYGIKAKNAQEVSDALAGAAVASSAGVQDIAQALAQVGPIAVDAGLGIDDTSAALAAFADKGIKGSDAGTSLKTFLTRLVPQTERAGNAFADLGLKMTDSEGNFRKLPALAQELQDGLRGLSDAERTSALNAAFGSDARRAALILANQGAEGIRKYTAETQKQGSADRMAASRMKGFAGAMEQFSGSVETLGISLGTLLLPAATGAMNVLTDAVNWLGDHQEVVIGFAAVVGGALVVAISAYAVSMASAAVTTIAATWPILAIIAAIGLLVAGVIWAYNNVEWFAKGVQLYFTVASAWFRFLWNIAKTVFSAIVTAVSAVIRFFTAKVVPAFRSVARFVIAAFKAWTFPIRVAIALVWAVVSWLIGKLRGPFAAVFRFIVAVVKSGVNAALTVWDRIKAIYTIIKGVFDKVAGAISGFFGPIISKVAGFVEKLAKPFTDLAGKAIDWGKDMIWGFINGIKSMGRTLWDSVSSFVTENVPGPVRAVLDLGSPSRLFEKYGRWTAEGLALGMEGGAGRVADAAKRMTPTRVPNPGWKAATGAWSAQEAPNVRVFIGDRELTDIVRVERDRAERASNFNLAYGRV